MLPTIRSLWNKLNVYNHRAASDAEFRRQREPAKFVFNEPSSFDVRAESFEHKVAAAYMIGWNLKCALLSFIRKGLVSKPARKSEKDPEEAAEGGWEAERRRVARRIRERKQNDGQN